MDNIIELFLKEHGLYKNIIKYNTIIFFIVMLLIFTKFQFFKESNGILLIIIFIFTLYLTNIYVKVSSNNLNDKNKITYFKLASLQDTMYDYIEYNLERVTKVGRLNKNDIQKIYKKNKLDSLYIDSNMIEFFYSIIQLYEYNKPEYYLLLKGTNNILKIRKEIENLYFTEHVYPENIHEMLQIALQLKVQCMNNIHNFIYSVPTTNIMYKYIDNIIQTYNVLISRNITIIYNYHLDYIKHNGINNKTIFIDITKTREYDENLNHSIIPGKIQNKQSLIDLYI